VASLIENSKDSKPQKRDKKCGEQQKKAGKDEEENMFIKIKFVFKIFSSLENNHSQCRMVCLLI